ncbi:sugar ABC transporter ATP-binding protein [Rahnella woolbedingensis]|uniref:Sugar ABC transporter ATP-binding protein n=1 Tax=Rahnella woolbedingensis TaxID=1510574 RepID=A0A419NCY3_9GAMM|nr:sugar ABC transporter ATP-binding protein [Rahnella woolbedingensis]RJT46336.1 sugar ABC transporter ATP-binding protein [Rahnella woolbedingensis]
MSAFAHEQYIASLSEDDTDNVAAIRGGYKEYPGVIALENVDFTLKRGEIRALLGKNGAGKSTLIRLLTGSEKPDRGTVMLGGQLLSGSDARLTRRAAELGVRAVYQELSLVDGLSVAENLYLGEWPRSGGIIDTQKMVQQAQHCLAHLGVDIDPLQRVENLSTAQKQLVEIARVMKGHPQVVILDEPTSSLASNEVELVIAAVRSMSEAGIAVVYVSHRMSEIRRLASSATIMRDGKVAGNVQLADASTREIVALMLGHSDHQNNQVTQSQGGEPVLTVRGMSLPPKLHDIHFELRRGEVLGIAGLLGSGRTELLNALAGLAPSGDGVIEIDGQVIRKPTYARMLALGLGYTPENRKDAGIMPLLGVDENTVMTNRHRVSRFGILQWPKVRLFTQEIIERMRIKTASTTTPIGTLSGGNQQKVVIGRWVYAGSRVLLLDEPTRGVDVEAKNQIYQIVRQLASEGKSIIFVSSEIEELPLVCDRILLLQKGTLTRTLTSPVNTETLMAEILASH